MAASRRLAWREAYLLAHPGCGRLGLVVGSAAATGPSAHRSAVILTSTGRWHCLEGDTLALAGGEGQGWRAPVWPASSCPPFFRSW